MEGRIPEFLYFLLGSNFVIVSFQNFVLLLRCSLFTETSFYKGDM